MRMRKLQDFFVIQIREEIAIMELELISHHFHMGLSHFLKNF